VKLRKGKKKASKSAAVTWWGGAYALLSKGGGSVSAQGKQGILQGSGTVAKKSCQAESRRSFKRGVNYEDNDGIQGGSV